MHHYILSCVCQRVVKKQKKAPRVGREPLHTPAVRVDRENSVQIQPGSLHYHMFANGATYYLSDRKEARNYPRLQKEGISCVVDVSNSEEDRTQLKRQYENYNIDYYAFRGIPDDPFATEVLREVKISSFSLLC